MAYSAHVIKSINDISQKEWNSLSNSIPTEYAWHKSVEDSQIITIKPRHIIIQEGTKIIAIAATYIQTDALSVNVEQSIFGSHAKRAYLLGIHLNPCLLCYSPMNVTGAGLMLHSQLTALQKEGCMRLISQKMETIAREENIPTFGFLNPPEDFFSSQGYTKITPSAEVLIDIQWDNLADYISSFPRKRRKNIKWEINTVKKEGIEIKELWSLKNHRKRLSELFNQTYEKYRPGEGWVSEDYIQTLEKNFPKRLFAVVAVHKEKIISACLGIIGKDTMFCFRAGKDENVPESCFSTFSTIIYHPLKMAMQRNLKYMWLGTGSYEYKINRGGYAHAAPLYLKSTTTSPLLTPILKVVDIIKKRRLNKWYNKR